jgi:hypothetical protein
LNLINNDPQNRYKKLNQIFLAINGKLMPCPGEYIGTLYNEYKSDDEMLYMIYSLENTLG